MPTASTYECAACGRTFDATQPATTCSPTCRTRERRKRQAHAAELLMEQTAAVIALTSATDAAEKARYEATLARLAAQARRILPAA